MTQEEIGAHLRRQLMNRRRATGAALRAQDASAEGEA